MRSARPECSNIWCFRPVQYHTFEKMVTELHFMTWPLLFKDNRSFTAIEAVIILFRKHCFIDRDLMSAISWLHLFSYNCTCGDRPKQSYRKGRPRIGLLACTPALNMAVTVNDNIVPALTTVAPIDLNLLAQTERNLTQQPGGHQNY